MRSAANPRRNNDSFARMLAAVAAASLATISGAPATKPTMPATMQSHHKPPAALALERGDDSIIGSVIRLVLMVYISLGTCGLCVGVMEFALGIGTFASLIRSQRIMANSPNKTGCAILKAAS